MKYYYDCEFLEGTQKERFPVSLFRKDTPPTIDLISIALVCEDGREYYAISKDFNLKEAWNRFEYKRNPPSNLDHDPAWQPLVKEYWIRDNVLKSIHNELAQKEYPYALAHEEYDWFSYKTMKYLLNKYGKTNKQIAKEVKDFCEGKEPQFKGYTVTIFDYKGTGTASSDKAEKEEIYSKGRSNPEFYGYYSAYDHVALCWLWGKMLDLPKGFPMYTRDLKQMLDEQVMLSSLSVDKALKCGAYPVPDKDRKHINHLFDEMLKEYKNSPEYPKQTNEHHALSDAKWNMELHKFISKL